MKDKPILITPGEPDSIFFEIFFKTIKLYKFKHPLILIASNKILISQMKKLKINQNIKLLNPLKLKNLKLDNKTINLINVEYKDSKDDIKKRKLESYIYIKNCFEIAFQILKSGLTNKFINGPINKNSFLKKKYLGVTEYISSKFKVNKIAMLIYNKDLSVCPLTTHLPIKFVTKKINQNLIKEKTKLINDFFKKNIGKKPKIAITGLNPHCESVDKFNEDEKILTPAIKSLKKRGFKVFGPLPADTIFLKQNRKKYDVILGMYHDQVLTPIKVLKEYDAINITLGLPFYRVSPDHGPNIKMVNKNRSNPKSLINALNFLDKR